MKWVVHDQGMDYVEHACTVLEIEEGRRQVTVHTRLLEYEYIYE